MTQAKTLALALLDGSVRDMEANAHALHHYLTDDGTQAEAEFGRVRLSDIRDRIGRYRLHSSHNAVAIAQQLATELAD